MYSTCTTKWPNRTLKLRLGTTIASKGTSSFTLHIFTNYYCNSTATFLHVSTPYDTRTYTTITIHGLHTAFCAHFSCVHAAHVTSNYYCYSATHMCYQRRSVITCTIHHCKNQAAVQVCAARTTALISMLPDTASYCANMSVPSICTIDSSDNASAACDTPNKDYQCICMVVCVHMITSHVYHHDE
jgi:hypothetical protein